jgi:hypothetical protein
MKSIFLLLILICFKIQAAENCSVKPIIEDGEYIGCKTEVNGRVKKHLPGIDGLTEEACKSFCVALNNKLPGHSDMSSTAEPRK